MESAGQIGIELRLLTDKLKGDIAAAAGVIKKDLSGTALSPVSDKAAAGMDKASASAEKLATNIGKVASAAKAMKQRLADIASGKLSPVEPGMRIRGAGDDAEAASRQARLEELRRYRAQGLRGYNVQDFFRGGQAGLGSQNLATSTYMGPTPPLIPPPVIPKQQTVGSMIEGFLNTKVNPMAKMFVGVTAALAGLRVVVGLVKYAFSLLMIPLNAMIKQAEEASRFYAKSLQSGGLPIGFTARRQMLAEVIGVGENEVLAFTQAMRMLGDGTRMSTAYIVDAIPALTTISWEWKMVKLDIKALSMTIAQDLVPAFHMLFTVLHVEIGKLTAVMKLMQFTPAFQQMMMAARLLGYKPAPPPEMSAKRYPVSNWERLGLVLEGRGAGMEPAKVTANATKKTAENTAKMIGILMGLSAGGLFPTGVPVPSPSRP